MIYLLVCVVCCVSCVCVYVCVWLCVFGHNVCVHMSNVSLAKPHNKLCSILLLLHLYLKIINVIKVMGNHKNMY